MNSDSQLRWSFKNILSKKYHAIPVSLSSSDSLSHEQSPSTPTNELTQLADTISVKLAKHIIFAATL